MLIAFFALVILTGTSIIMGVYSFGSLNLDLVIQAPHLPQPGETLMGSQFQTLSGGKGANQAVAAARLGATTRLVGRVGSDDFGRQLLESVQGAGVDVAGVTVDDQMHTGLALITVATGGATPGENQIVLAAGSNGRVGQGEVDYLAHALGSDPGAHWLLVQLEVPLGSVVAAATVAKGRGATVILDPAPVPVAGGAALESLWPWVDILTPNEGEAQGLLGRSWQGPQEALAAAQALGDRTGIGTIIITRGSQGIVCVRGSQTWILDPFPVQTVDTTAAGDAFNGGLAVALGEGQPWDEALRWAMAAGALATTQRGAQDALPDRSAVERLLRG